MTRASVCAIASGFLEIVTLVIARMLLAESAVEKTPFLPPYLYVAGVQIAVVFPRPVLPSRWPTLQCGPAIGDKLGTSCHPHTQDRGALHLLYSPCASLEPHHESPH